MQIGTAIDEDIWWDVATKCDYATFFHTPLWHKLILMTFPEYRDVSLEITLGNGTLAIFPLLETRNIRGVGKSIYSSFAGCYGDLIADGPISDDDRQTIFGKLRSRRISRIQITHNPINEGPPTDLSISEEKDYTHILLLNSSFNTVFSNFSKGHRSSYKKGLKMNVRVRPATSINDYHAYYNAYQDSLQRWGERASMHYPRMLFENGFQLAKIYPDNIKLWLATVNEKVIAGAWVFYWNQHVDWWHGAAYASYFDHYPNNVLQTHIIIDALEKGYKFYDFNPSGGHENVARFKARFGAKKLPISRWEYETIILQVGRKILRFMR